MGRKTGSLHLLAPLLLTGGKGADLVIRGNVVLNRKNGRGWRVGFTLTRALAQAACTVSKSEFGPK
jgi:hypothetical protein